MLNLPEGVNGSITFVVYLCFPLLIVMVDQSKISKHKLSEPNDAESKPNRQSYTTVHQKSRRRERKKFHKRKFSMKVGSTIPQERLSSWLMLNNYGYIENLTGKLKEILASLIII